MTLSELSVTVTAAAVTVAALNLGIMQPVYAQDAICAQTMANVESILTGQGVPYMVIDAGDLAAFAEQVKPITGVAPSEVTGALVADGGSGLIFGLETTDGCFSPQPMLLAAAASGPYV